MAEAPTPIVGGWTYCDTTEFALELQMWGTPERCFERVMDARRRTGAEAFTGVFSDGGMPDVRRRGEPAPVRGRGDAGAEGMPEPKQQA